jgi:hypothetical protein
VDVLSKCTVVKAIEWVGPACRQGGRSQWQRQRKRPKEPVKNEETSRIQ